MMHNISTDKQESGLGGSNRWKQLMEIEEPTRQGRTSPLPRKKKRCTARQSTPGIESDDDDSSLISRKSTSSRRKRSSKSKKLQRSSRSPTRGSTTLQEGSSSIIDSDHDDDSSLISRKSAKSSQRKRSSKSKSSRSPTRESAKLQALQEQIDKLNSVQLEMEKYQASLEMQHREFERQIDNMELCLEMTESRNRELESHLEEALEENDRLLHGRRSRIRPQGAVVEEKQEEDDDDTELLCFENQILRGKLERCEKALLSSSIHSECR